MRASPIGVPAVPKGTGMGLTPYAKKLALPAGFIPTEGAAVAIAAIDDRQRVLLIR